MIPRSPRVRRALIFLTPLAWLGFAYGLAQRLWQYHGRGWWAARPSVAWPSVGVAVGWGMLLVGGVGGILYGLCWIVAWWTNGGPADRPYQWPAPHTEQPVAQLSPRPLPFSATAPVEGGLVRPTQTLFSMPNDPERGTALHHLAKLTPAGTMVLASDLGTPLYLCTASCGTTGAGVFALVGEGMCLMDESHERTMAWYVTQSARERGRCHAQVSEPLQGQAVGMIEDQNIVAGMPAHILIQHAQPIQRSP